MSWSVMLAGAMKPYDAEVSRVLEAAWQKDDKDVLVTIRGAQYKIDFTTSKQIAVTSKRKLPSFASSDPDTAPASKTKKAPTPAPESSPAAPAGSTSDAAASSSPASAKQKNDLIHSTLVELGETEKVRGDSIRANAYFKAARAVKAFDEPITSGAQAKKKLSGIGDKIAKKIDELLKTGTLERLERDRVDPAAIAKKELTRVSGIGAVFAHELYTAHSIADLPQLAAAYERDPSLLTHEQAAGLRHVADFESRIPRDEMGRLEAVVRAHAEKHDPPLQMAVCGSYRRGKQSSGDIDCLLCHPSFVKRDTPEAQWPAWLASLTAALRESGFVTDTLAQGRKKCALVCKLPDAQAASGGAGGESASQASTAAPAPDTASSAPAPAPPAPPLVGGFKLPTFKDVQARKKAAREGTDLFSSWQAAKGANSSSPNGAGAGANGAGASASGSSPSGPVSMGAAGSSSDGAFGGGFGSPQFGDAFDDVERTRYRRLDLRLCAYETYHASTLYFTGSDEHNKLMRNRAIERGYKLNEYGLFKVVDGEVADAPEPASSEHDLFALLGMPYATPKERDL